MVGLFLPTCPCTSVHVGVLGFLRGNLMLLHGIATCYWSIYNIDEEHLLGHGYTRLFGVVSTGLGMTRYDLPLSLH